MGKALTKQQKSDFIKKLRLTGGNVSKACGAIKISRSAAYEHKKSDSDFAELWEEAINAGVDDLIEELRRRALKGVRKPVYQGKQLVGYIREYSDTLGIFIVKAHRPEYRDRITQDVNLRLEDMSDEQLERLARGERVSGR